MPIHAEALARRDAAGGASVVITLDLVGIRREMAEPIAERAGRELHVRREPILFNVSAHAQRAPLVDDASVYTTIMGSAGTV